MRVERDCVSLYIEDMVGFLKPQRSVLVASQCMVKIHLTYTGLKMRPQRVTVGERVNIHGNNTELGKTLS
jgi:hypothetical protein